MKSHLVYLHGFNSSPDSDKAQATARWFEAHVPEAVMHIPNLPIYPESTIACIQKVLHEIRGDSSEPIAFIGSSMGGFYANHFADVLNTRAVLINPVVFPQRLLKDFLGEQLNPISGERFVLQESHLHTFGELLIDPMQRPRDRMVLLQTGDETLDYRDAAGYFAGSDLHIEPDGDHGFQGYENWLPAIADFLMPR